MATGYVRQDVANEISEGEIINDIPLDAEFNQLEDAFNATTGHNHDGTIGSGGPITTIGPAQDFIFSSTALYPKTSNAYDLGSASPVKSWKNGYFAGDVFCSNVVTTARSLLQGISLTTDGSSGTAAIYFDDDVDTGWYTAEDGSWSFASDHTPILQLSGTGLNVSSGANISISGGGHFTGNGSGITNINASSLSTGTIPTARVVGIYGNITGVGTLNTGAISSGFGNIDIGSNVFTGIGSGLTQLNASNLSTGTVPNGRLSGSYTGITNITSTYLTATTFLGSAGSVDTPTFSFAGDPDTGWYRTGAGQASFAASGVRKLAITGDLTLFDGDINISGAGSFTGVGSALTTLNATQLTSGTVPNARISGSYDGFVNITSSGAITANEFRGDDGAAGDPPYTFTSDNLSGMYLSSTNTLGFSTSGTVRARINSTGLILDSGTFQGNGSDLTALVATQLTSGTVPSARLGTTSGDNTWVGDRFYANVASTNSGAMAFATASGTTGYDRGDTIAGTSLTTAAANATGTTTLTGTWKCLGYVKANGNPQERATMWVKS
jgi:hypothetical protein